MPSTHAWPCCELPYGESSLWPKASKKQALSLAACKEPRAANNHVNL